MMPERIKILYLSWSGAMGGAEIALLRTVRFLDRERFVPRVLQFQPGPMQKELEVLNIPVEVLNVKRFRSVIFSIPFFIRLFRKIRQEKIQLIHAVGTQAWLAGFLPARLAGIPHLWWVVDLPDGSNNVEKLAARLPASGLVCNSRATMEAFRAVYPFNRSKAVVIHPPNAQLDSKSGDLAARAAALRLEFGVTSSQPLILSLGRMQRWKGQETLAAAIPAVLKRIPSAVFIFAGGTLPGMEDGTEARLKAMAKELKVDAHCRFPGYCDDAQALIASADCVVHTSLKPEPFGMVITESMALGKAVIATEKGGPQEIITHGVDGILVPAGEPQLLAQAIISFEDPAYKKKLEENARASARRFEPAAIARQMENLYMESLKK